MVARAELTRRAIAMGRRGMVATEHPLATKAGIDALERGGNAMDAALAAALTTGVVLPAMAGPGADAFCLYYEAKSGTVTAINGSGIAPARATRDYFIERGYAKMPFIGPLAVSVPGAVDVYFSAIERFATMNAETLFAPAIYYAEHGFPLTHTGHKTIAGARERLAQFPESAAIYLPNGAPPAPGSLLKNPNLARSLRLLVAEGRDALYRGALGAEIDRWMRENGGLLTADDMRDHESKVYAPPSTDYRGYTVYETAPPSQGVIVLEELNIIANADLADLGAGSADAIHLLVEAKKRAYADRLCYCGDPEFIDVPMDVLTSPEFGRRRFATIDMGQAQQVAEPGLLAEALGDTTYLCAVDGDGNAVSFIHSLSAGFGCQAVAGNTGFLLNNRAGRGFTLEEGHPNVIAPRKKTMHTLNCYLITENGRPRWVGGTPGGDGQPQWNLQVITNLIDHGMDVQSAVEAPRWTSFPGTDPAGLPNDFVLRIERRAGAEVIANLERRGHTVIIQDDWAGGGSVQLIEIDGETGVLFGGSDARTEGLALGF